MAEERDEVGEKIAELLLVSRGAWAIKVGDQSVRIINLAPGVIGELQRKFGVPWEVIFRFPLTYLDLAEALVGEAEKKLRVKPKNSCLPIDDTVELLNLFVSVESDLPVTPPLERDDDDGAPQVDPTNAS